MSLFHFIKKTLSFDLRSLALYRVLIGFIVMADVLYRWEDLANFYTDVGIVPRAIFSSELAMPWSFSLHLANGSIGFAMVMFGLHLLFGAMIVLGFKFRWAILGAFIMTVSVHNRNWLVNNGGDDILRAILFISIFLPLNKCFSLDSALTQKEERASKEHFSTWGLTFFLQAFVIYFVSYLLKDHPIWRSDFTAVFFSSRLEIFATPFVVWLRQFPGVLKFITAFTIYLEWLGPLALVFSFLFGKFWWRVRTLVVVLFWGLHLGIIATMSIGIFPYTCMAMWTIFLPGELWDKFFSSFRKKGFGKLTLYYDGDCLFCHKTVLILREFLLLPEVAILKGQDSAMIYAEMKKQNSWIVMNREKKKFFQYHGMLELLRHSPLVFWTVPFFSISVIEKLGQKIYFWISHNRPILGILTQCFDLSVPKKTFSAFTYIYQALGAFVFLTLLMWNLTTIKKWEIRAPFFQNVTRWLHLYQEWNMFAPYPKTDNIWIETPALLSDGTELDLLTGDPDIYSIKDKAFYRSVKNEHWRKLYLNISDNVNNARYFSAFLCRQWNERGIRRKPNTTLRKFEVIVFSQPNLVDGDKGGIARKLSWNHWCFDEDYRKESGNQRR